MKADRLGQNKVRVPPTHTASTPAMLNLQAPGPTIVQVSATAMARDTRPMTNLAQSMDIRFAIGPLLQAIYSR